MTTETKPLCIDGTSRHHMAIETPSGSTVHGRCKKCDYERDYPTTTDSWDMNGALRPVAAMHITPRKPGAYKPNRCMDCSTPIQKGNKRCYGCYSKSITGQPMRRGISGVTEGPGFDDVRHLSLSGCADD